MIFEHENPQSHCPAEETSNCTEEQRQIYLRMMEMIMHAVDEAMILGEKHITAFGEYWEIDRQARFIADTASRYAHALAETKKQLIAEVQSKEAAASSVARIPCRAVRAEHLGTALASVP